MTWICVCAVVSFTVVPSMFTKYENYQAASGGGGGGGSLGSAMNFSMAASSLASPASNASSPARKYLMLGKPFTPNLLLSCWCCVQSTAANLPSARQFSKADYSGERSRLTGLVCRELGCG